MFGPGVAVLTDDVSLSPSLCLCVYLHLDSGFWKYTPPISISINICIYIYTPIPYIRIHVPYKRAYLYVCVCVCLNIRIGARTHIGYYLISSRFPALCFCRDILMTDTYEENFSREGTFNIYPRSNYPRAGTNLERVIFTFLLEATFEIQA